MTGASVAHHLLNDQNTVGQPGNRLSVVMLEAREACWGATGRVCCMNDLYPLEIANEFTRMAAIANLSCSSTLTTPASRHSSC